MLWLLNRSCFDGVDADCKCMSKYILLFISCCGLVLFSGCQTTATSGSSTTTFAPIDYDEAFKLGQKVKFRDSGMYMARTSGTSMEPVLTKNTIIIVRPIEFEDLEVGMTVGYLTKDGQRVLHQLVRKAGSDAWIAKGINNAREDQERVTRKNLLGVLYTVLYNNASEVR